MGEPVSALAATPAINGAAVQNRAAASKVDPGAAGGASPAVRRSGVEIAACATAARAPPNQAKLILHDRAHGGRNAGAALTGLLVDIAAARAATVSAQNQI